MIKQRKPLHSRYFRVFEAKPVKTLYNRAFSSVSPLKEPVPDGVIGAFHRPHPRKEAKPYQVKDAREFLKQLGVQP